VVMNEYSYTSTLPVGRTACTEPQCLYKGALYLLPLPLFEINIGKYSYKQYADINRPSPLFRPLYYYRCDIVCIPG